MHALTRRRFLATGSTASMAAVLPFQRRRHARRHERLDAWAQRSDIGALEEVQFQTLALQAVDAAKRAGATYADVRITRTLSLQWDTAGSNPALSGSSGARLVESQVLAAGVRALVNGYWGFASGPYWTKDEMERLGREAVAQAKVNARGKARTVELGTMPAATGRWTTPIQIDPFSLSWDEIEDYGNGWMDEVYQQQFGNEAIGARVTFQLRRIEKTCASTEGSLFTQTTYATSGSFGLLAGQNGTLGRQGGRAGIELPSVGAGWEYIQEAKVFAQIPRLIEEGMNGGNRVSLKPVEPGRYPMVMSGQVMAAFLANTFGPATQVDRALGYEANAGGTSFLNQPLEMLGQLAVAAPGVSITADRTLARGLSTVRWDDEGVVATPFPLVEKGILVDYQTTREQAAWLAPAYERRSQPVQSHGCTDTASGLDLPMQHTPNLVMTPGATDLDFDDLVAQVPRGFAFIAGSAETDFQARHGSGRGVIREIVKGKLGAVIQNAGILFDTTELWKNLTTLGGARSHWQGPSTSIKGEPQQTCEFSVSAVPAVVKEVALIDITRRA